LPNTLIVPVIYLLTYLPDCFCTNLDLPSTNNNCPARGHVLCHLAHRTFDKDPAHLLAVSVLISKIDDFAHQTTRLTALEEKSRC